VAERQRKTPKTAADGPATSPRARRKPKEQDPRAKTLAQQTRFLAQFAEIGVVTTAAKLAGIDRQRHYEWLDASDKYPDYGERFAAASEQAADVCEAEMMRRGVTGWEEPVYGSGGTGVGTVQVGSKIVFSDRMLELALKARRPQKFRERVEHTGAGGGPIQATVSFTLPDNGRRAASD
jgi:hypothetical protein